MGSYTEFHFNSQLKRDTPLLVVSTLAFMVGDDAPEPRKPPDHPLFGETRWRFMLRCESYYFDARANSTVTHDSITSSWFLCIRTSFKNYDDEIAKFLDWISPYLDKYEGDFLGFYRDEETEQPVLIHALRDSRHGP